jgi:hypothetical protein
MLPINHPGFAQDMLPINHPGYAQDMLPINHPLHPAIWIEPLPVRGVESQQVVWMGWAICTTAPWPAK